MFTAGVGVDVQRQTLPRIVTPYLDSVDGTRARVTYQNVVTRAQLPSTPSRYGVTIRGNVTSV
jgi:hypothetical protein